MFIGRVDYMTSKARGTHLEYRVQHYIQDKGLMVIRSSGSHTVVDLVVLSKRGVILVQCKIGGLSNVSKKERSGLVKLTELRPDYFAVCACRYSYANDIRYFAWDSQLLDWVRRDDYFEEKES
jgi:hypothetical protein